MSKNRDKKLLAHLAANSFLAPGMAYAMRTGMASVRPFLPIYAKISSIAKTNTLFFRAFLQDPVKVGSLCPSSHMLAGAMVAQAIGDTANIGGLFIDLGVGNGIVTEHLLANEIPPNRILGVEISEIFAGLYRKRFPNINIVTLDARYLANFIKNEYGHCQIAAVISSLPLRSLPLRDVAIIINRLRRLLLAKGGIFVQFTYALWMRAILQRYGLALLGRKYVFQNFPPAMIESYSPIQTKGA